MTTAEPHILELEEVRPAAQQPAPANLPALSENSPMAMMLTAQRQGASLAEIREMMAIHREYEAAEAKKAFDESFAGFRGENVIIPKTKHVDRGRGGSFDQAEYDEVCRRLSPALSRHGFGFRHDQKFGSRKWTTEGVENDVPWVWVTCHLAHRKGHTETLELEGPPGDLSVNTPTQNMQTTASYLKRQSLLAITGTATGGEDDEAAMRRRGGESLQDQWVKKAAEAASVDDLVGLSKDGTEAFNKARDVEGYRAFTAALNARRAELRKGNGNA